MNGEGPVLPSGQAADGRTGVPGCADTGERNGVNLDGVTKPSRRAGKWDPPDEAVISAEAVGAMVRHIVGDRGFHWEHP